MERENGAAAGRERRRDEVEVERKNGARRVDLGEKSIWGRSRLAVCVSE